MDDFFEMAGESFFQATKSIRAQKNIDNHDRKLLLKEMRKNRRDLASLLQKITLSEKSASRSLDVMRKKMSEGTDMKHHVSKQDVKNNLVRLNMYKKQKEEINKMITNLDSLMTKVELSFSSMAILNTLNASENSSIRRMTDETHRQAITNNVNECKNAMTSSTDLMTSIVHDVKISDIADEEAEQMLEEIGLGRLKELFGAEYEVPVDDAKSESTLGACDRRLEELKNRPL